MPRMNDGPQRPDTSLSLREAAARAAVNERTLRRWITSGRLLAAKDDGQYRITVANLERARRVAPGAIRTSDRDSPDARASEPDRSDMSELGHRTVDMPASDRVPGLDLTPMVSLIERQARELAEYREAAAVWQDRARTLEQRLLQLTARTDAPGGAVGSTENDDNPLKGIRRWWRKIRGL
jgi:excisionase family DNA binding protein